MISEIIFPMDALGWAESCSFCLLTRIWQSRAGRLPTALSRFAPAGLQFAHDYLSAEEVSLPAMRDDGRSLRLRKVLLPVPIADGSPALRRQFVLLQAMPGSVRL